MLSTVQGEYDDVAVFSRVLSVVLVVDVGVVVTMVALGVAGVLVVADVAGVVVVDMVVVVVGAVLMAGSVPDGSLNSLVQS